MGCKWVSITRTYYHYNLRFWRKIICAKFINCSYIKIARSISFVDKIDIFVWAGKYSYTLELLQLVNPLIVIIFKLFANFVFELACLQLRCRCTRMYRLVKRLTRFKLVAKKHVYGGFIKVIIKKGLRDKEGLVCLIVSSKCSLLKPNNLVTMTSIFTCLFFAQLVSKVMYILNIRYYITEKDLSSCRHMNRCGS